MSEQFPSAAPEIPVSNVARAALYYEKCLGFRWDWGMEEIGQVSRGRLPALPDRRRFSRGEESGYGGAGGHLDLNSKAEVDGLHEAWSNSGARIVSARESMPWNLHEFTAADLDGNLLRVFYDFAWGLPDRGGRVDDAAEREAARAKA
jgi:glyoxalase/bleomycin resistance protein/dioxygenase superfamily protein